MAAAIMSVLAVAALLTALFLPALYAARFKVSVPKDAGTNETPLLAENMTE